MYRILLIFFMVMLPLTILNAIIVPYEPSDKGIFISEPFFRLEPLDDGKLEVNPTKLWLFYDDNFLYIHIETPWDTNYLKGTYTRRDEGTHADNIKIMLVTNQINRIGYIFGAYPLGNLEDSAVDEGGEISNWDCNYTYCSAIEDSCWHLDIQIPFSELRVHEKAPYQFRIIIYRNYVTNNEVFTCPRLRQNDNDELFGKGMDLNLEHSITIRKLSFTAKPYINTQYDAIKRKAVLDKNHVGSDFQAIWNLHTKLKVTIQPDFSDVPLDDATNVYNMKTSPTFEENRYFFRDDLNVLQVPLSLLYTRNINQPLWAARITSSGESTKIGYMCAFDKKVEEDGLVYSEDDLYQAAGFTSTSDNHVRQIVLTSRSHQRFASIISMLQDNWHISDNNNLIVKYYQSYWNQSNVEHSIYGSGVEASFMRYTKSLDVSISAKWLDHNIRSDAGLMNPMFDMYYNHYFNPVSVITYHHNYDMPSLQRLFVSITSSKVTYLQENVADPWYILLTNGIDFKKYSLSLRYDFGQNTLQNKSFPNQLLIIDYYNNQWSGFNYSLDWGLFSDLVYALGKVCTFRRYSFGISGNIVPILNYGIDTRLYDYEVKPDSNYTDNQYLLTNVHCMVQTANNMAFRTGLNIDTYSHDFYKGKIGFYINYSWEINKRLYTYMGYSTKRYQYQQQMEHLEFSKFITDFSTVYCKISYTL